LHRHELPCRHHLHGTTHAERGGLVRG
jgi:hypothetical protein